MKVTIVGLNKWYGNVHALKDINVTIDSGKFTTLLGPSGCGKTTLLRIIAGLETPDSGEIYFGEKCIFSAEKKISVSTRKRELGMVFQEFALWPHMNVFENVAYSLKARKKKVDIDEQVKKALNMVQLEGMETRFPSQMSGGQQQRVSFARAVVSNPDIVLFDEPLSALDAVLREGMRRELVSMVNDMSLTAIYVTHDQIEAMSMSDNIIVMNKGEILQVGEPEEIYERPTHSFLMDFVGKINWISSGKKGIRPENITLFTREESCVDGSEYYKGFVKDVAYLGEKYELNIEVDDIGLWQIYYHKRLKIGEPVSLFIEESKIINLV